GIVPGETTLEQARAKVEAVYNQLTGYAVSFNVSTHSESTLTAQIASMLEPQDRIQVSFHEGSSGKISIIFFQFDSDNRPNIADFFTMLGSPTHLSFATRIRNLSTILFDLSFFGQHCSIIIGGTYPRDQIDYTQQPHTLVFRQPTSCAGEEPRWQTWRGLRRIIVSFR